MLSFRNFFSSSDTAYSWKSCLSCCESTMIQGKCGTCTLSGTAATARDCNGSRLITFVFRIIMTFGGLILLRAIVVSIWSFFGLMPSRRLGSSLSGLCLHRTAFFYPHDSGHYMLR
jgi:hypothetical protein